ncbi:MAG: FtsX-like permease family protein [Lachnospiraceae bacterium]|nr:FtsX-like permease family protein [Lachnospiraceae bacterium]
MIRHSAKNRDVLRTIARTKSRFFSILLIVALGVGFFGGLRASGDDMALSADSKYKDQNLAHFRLLSTWGFDEKDAAALQEIGGTAVRTSYFIDSIATAPNVEDAARIFAYRENDEINELLLTQGRFPTKADECLADHASSIAVGERVILTGKGNETPIVDSLKNTAYTVVGKVDSAMYISAFEHGNTNIGSGAIGFILYVPEENFLSEYYTESLIVFDDMKELTAYTEAYEEASDRHKAELEALAEERTAGRLRDQIADAEKALRENTPKLREAETALQGAEALLTAGFRKWDRAKEYIRRSRLDVEAGEKELEDKTAELEDAAAEAAEGRKTLEEKQAELAQAEAQLEEGELQYYAGVNQYELGYAAALVTYADERALLTLRETELRLAKERAASRVQEYEEAKASYDEDLAAYEKDRAEADKLDPVPPATELELLARKAALDARKAALDRQKALIDSTNETVARAEERYAEAKEAYDKEAGPAFKQLEDAKKQLDAAKRTIDANRRALNSGKAQLAAAFRELEAGEAEIEAGRKALEEAREKLEDAKDQLNKGEAELKAQLETIEKSRDEYLKAAGEVEDGKAALRTARIFLEDPQAPEWIIYPRSEFNGYEEYGQNADRIRNIAKVFPAFFILVAALVCMTTMTRMIEEERSQIGTMKALGYSYGSILLKYVLYGLVATLGGSVIGLAIGYKLFPWVIIKTYGIMYSIKPVALPFHFLEAVLITIGAVAIISLTVWLTTRGTLRQTPAQLMRPKAPKPGKRVLLEKWTWLWSKLSFNRKVSLRNLFRYKKRMVMTIVGISGCTALLLTGFALSDSINGILRNQFGPLWKYQAIVAINEGLTEEDRESISETLRTSDPEGQDALAMQQSFTFVSGKTTCSAYLLVTESSEALQKMITLKERKGLKAGETYTLEEGGVIISEKMGKVLGAGKGDRITIRIEEGRERELLVQEVAENYVYHYVYMLPGTYKEVFGVEPVYNQLMLRYDLSGPDEHTMAERVLKVPHTISMMLMSDMIRSFSTLLKALDLVVLVLILSASALAFIVLYNLSNINITERVREIATLEVLGSTDREVSQYIFRETILLTVLGIGFGLVLGRFLAAYVIQTAEIDLVMFGREVKWQSYVYAAALTMVFTLLNSLIMRKPLRKISMVESLKSVE